MRLNVVDFPAPLGPMTVTMLIENTLRSAERALRLRGEDDAAMMAKLQAGGAGLYDVVVPPDHRVPALIKLNLLAPLRAASPARSAGYWLMRSVYAYSQSMGVTMMGGLLTWLFVVQALLIGALFLGVNYYLWQSMGRIRGGERYQPYYQYLLLALTGCLFIWLTPHTLLMTGTEVKAMGGEGIGESRQQGMMIQGLGKATPSY